MDELVQDLRYALRQIVGAPVLSAVTLLVLAVGIGANAVVLSVLNGVLFNPPPGVGDSEGLVEISSLSASDGRTAGPTYAEFLAIRDQTAAFSGVAVYQQRRVAFRGDDAPEMVRAELASSDYFVVLDLGMELGTGFVPGDDRQAGAAAHAVLGYAFWQGRMGASADAVGRTIDVNGRPYTVIGVAPPRFYGAEGEDDPVAVWLPVIDYPLLFPDQANLTDGEQPRLRAVARLADGVAIPRAESAARNAARGIEASTGVEASARSGAGVGTVERRITITPYRGVGSRIMSAALAFVGVVGGLIGGLVLLIACANASGLLLSRAVGRRREMGIRLSLGAGRRRILRQLLTESLLLAALAGAAGTLLTFSTLDALERTLFTFPVDLQPSLPVLALTMGVTAATGLAFGLVPALHATRASVSKALKDDVAGLGRGSSRLRDGFTVAQLALSLPLLTAAGLLVVQVAGMEAGSGFENPGAVLTVHVDLGHSGYNPDEVGPLLSQIDREISALPGVASASFATAPPLGRSPYFAVPLARPDENRLQTWRRSLRLAVVDPDYFTTMGIPILRGRSFTSDDLTHAPLVAVVDEEAAALRWPGEDPLGKALFVGEGREQRPITVVGVARTVLTGTGWSSSLAYAARAQLPDTSSTTLLVRARDGSASTIASAVRSELRAMDPDLVVSMTTLSEELHNPEMTHASAGAVVCGLLALLLACIGLCAMVATGVAERTREIGVRLALGADQSRVVRLFVQKGLTLTIVALGVGLPLSWAMIPVVGTSVVGVTALAPEVAVALAAVALLLTAVAGLASWLPARRSATVDPVLALRSE